jgi:hypothetical protein
MRRGVCFPKWATCSERFATKPRQTAMMARLHHRRLAYEVLEDRRLLSIVIGDPVCNVTNVNELPWVTVDTPSSPQSGNMEISFTLFDPESDLCNIVVHYSLDEGATWLRDWFFKGNMSNLDSSPEGVEHTITWDTVNNLGKAKHPNVKIRITPIDEGYSGTAATTDTFIVDNYVQPFESWQDTIGLFDVTASQFHLRNTNDSGYADTTFDYSTANADWKPLAGDWNMDGIDTIGLYNPVTSQFELRNSNDSGSSDVTFQYGPANAGWTPIAGDWDGDGKDTIGLYNPTTSIFYLRNTNGAGFADINFQYGPAGANWLPIAGDWNGDGKDTVGLYNPSGGKFFLRNTNSAGHADNCFFVYNFRLDCLPVVGDWDADGRDFVGLYDSNNSKYFLWYNSYAKADANYSANYASAYLTFFGTANPGCLPIAGSWNGPLPTLSINNVTLPEGNNGTTDFVFTVTLSKAVSWDVMMQYGDYTFYQLPDKNIGGIEAARGMGMEDIRIFTKIRLPLAANVILAGIRTSLVINISAATLAAAVGAGGLGVLVVNGVKAFDPVLILEGAIPVSLMAVIADLVMKEIERKLSYS